MSWFSSWSSIASKPPQTPIEQAAHEQRLLEEPSKITNVPRPQTAEPNQAPVTVAATSTPPAAEGRQVENPNPNRNRVIFGAGLAFFAFSLLITRRSFARKRLAANPAFYTNAPGHHVEQMKKMSPAMEAFEALNIATVNVLSVTMLATGGALWYLDINSMAEARQRLRGGLGVDGTGLSEKDAEEEFEEWMATTLARKDSKILKQVEAAGRK